MLDTLMSASIGSGTGNFNQKFTRSPNSSRRGRRASVSLPKLAFRDNGQDGLHLAHSRDGLKWFALNSDRSFLAPTVGTKLMRDPSIARGPGGTFHMVWTTGWWDRGIGVAHSKDLIAWSEQKSIPVMEHEPTAVNCWAPELFYDDATKQFLIFWSTTIPGRFPKTDDSGDPGHSSKLNHRMYYVTTKDFQSYSDTKLFYDGGFNVIDGTIAKDGDRYVLIVKDETKQPVAKKHLRLAMGTNAVGPFGAAGEPITPDWVEGPSALKVGNAWMIYFDEYTRKRYGAIRTIDWKTWTNISEQVDLPAGTRHGTAFEVPEEIATVLMKIKPR
jgi:Glycosyl hydrolases family 43